MLPDPEVFDPDVALASVGDDPVFLCEVAGLFQAASPTLLSNIRTALASRDLCAVGWSAHLVKTAATNVSAKRVCESAFLLETVADLGDLRRVEQAVETLEDEVRKLQSALFTLQAALSTTSGHS